MKLRLALVVFYCVLEFKEVQLQVTCLSVGLGCTAPVPQTFFRFYRSPTDYTDVNKNNCSALTSVPGFDVNKSTTFFIHGWTESVNKPCVLTIASVYTTVKEENIVAFDWSVYSINMYRTAASKVLVAANESLDMLECFIAAGLRADSIKLVGFSMGGQMVGAIGNTYKQRHNKTIRHITALDPAMPSFYPFGNNLNKDSGDFVSVIHTTSGSLGLPPSFGTVDFIPNAGTVPQPYCPLGVLGTFFNDPLTTWDTAVNMSQLTFVCDHHCAWKFYAQSVLQKDSYLAGCVDKDSTKCKFGNDTAIMGYATPVSARGLYQLYAICPDTLPF